MKRPYICSCLSGFQFAGCCVHITAVLYYLGHLKEKLKKNKTIFQSPSKHLKNILVDINNNSKVNEPEYVRQKEEIQTCHIPILKIRM
jgi:hypothetical protein